MTALVKSSALAVFAIFYFASAAQNINYVQALDNSVYLSKQSNGLNALITSQPAAGNVQITLYVKTGTVYENDSISGMAYILQKIIADKLADYLRKNKSGISSENTTMLAYSTTELSVFQLTSSPANYLACLQLLRDSVLQATFSEEEVKNKVEAIRAEIASGKNNYKTAFETKLLVRLFRKDVARQILIGDTVGAYTFIDIEHLETFYEKYYSPNNSLLNASGNLDVIEFQNKLSETFKVLSKSKFDHETIAKIIDFKAMVYSTQFTQNAPIDQPQFEIYWQFPGVRSNVKSSYYAFLLTAMLNDPNNHIQVKARKMGCRKLVAEYDANNFSGIFKIILQPDKQKLFETYHYVLNEIQRLDETLINESMMKVGMLNFQKEYDHIKQSKDYIARITKYWIYDDITYYSTLKDSVFLLGERRMRKFVIEYIKQSAYVTGLLINETDRVALQVDSLLPDLDPSVNEYVFRYRPNITDLEGPENLTMRSNLLHWLKVNTDLTVQVNGCSDHGEFSKTRDDSIRLFIDSMPTFSKVKQDIVKSGTLRPEMMRAMKIIKYLYDNGIEADRLKGTSMPFSSKDKTEELENMKCTLTIEKIRKAPSVYEYHYGKTKQQNER